MHKSSHPSQQVLDAYIDASNAYAHRGSAQDTRYHLMYAETIARTVKSSAVLARVATRYVHLNNRLRKLDLAEGKVEEATTNLAEVSFRILPGIQGVVD